MTTPATARDRNAANMFYKPPKVNTGYTSPSRPVPRIVWPRYITCSTVAKSKTIAVYALSTDAT